MSLKCGLHLKLTILFSITTIAKIVIIQKTLIVLRSQQCRINQTGGIVGDTSETRYDLLMYNNMAVMTSLANLLCKPSATK